MKNYKTIKKIALTLLITSGLLISSAHDLTPNPTKISMEVPVWKHSPNDQVVKAIIINGEAFPMIDLPVVEITAKANQDNLVRAEVINGEIVPSILLDVVTITPNSSSQF